MALTDIIDFDNDIVRTIDLHLDKKTNISTVDLKQYDENAIFIVASLWNNSAGYNIPTDTTSMFCASKPDGYGVANNCMIVANKIVYKVSLQTIAKEGFFSAEFKLYRTINGEAKNILLLRLC